MTQTENSYRLAGLAEFFHADADRFWQIMKQYRVVKLGFTDRRPSGRTFEPYLFPEDTAAIQFAYFLEFDYFEVDKRRYFIRRLMMNGRPNSGDPKHLVHQTVLEGKPSDYGYIT